MAQISYPSSWDFGREPERGTAFPQYPMFQEPKEQQAALFKPPADPRDDIGVPSGNDLDSTPVGFGKYRTRTPLEILAIDPGWLVWAMAETGRLLCSEEIHMQAKRRKQQLAAQQNIPQIRRRSGGFIPR